MRDFIESLQGKFQCLESLLVHAKVGKHMIKNGAMIALGGFLENQKKSLKQISISFSGPTNEITCEGLCAFSKGLYNHKKLRVLDLRFK